MHQRYDDGTKPYLVFFHGRRTAHACRATSASAAISEARKSKKRGGEKVVRVRLATEEEQKVAAKGGWIRSGPDGPDKQPPGYDRATKRGHGPKPKGYKGDSIKPSLRLAKHSKAYIRGFEDVIPGNLGATTPIV